MPARTLGIASMPLLLAGGIIVTLTGARIIFGVKMSSEFFIIMVLAALTISEVNQLVGGITGVFVGKTMDVAPGVDTDMLAGADSKMWTAIMAGLEFITMLVLSEEALCFCCEPCSC